MPKQLAVFGNPVLHSRSPLMLNALLQEKGFYTRIRVNSGADLALAVRTLGLVGANVTAPFKETLMPYMDELSEEVLLIGGANTIVNDDGRLKAYNTDWYGATEAIKHAGIELKGLKIVLLGLGGAGKAVAYGLVSAGADVTLVNRTLSKAEELSQRLGCTYAPIEELQPRVNGCQLFISTVLPTAELPSISIPKEVWVFDANYHKSPLVERAKANGNGIVDASKWLLFQAVKSYEYYLGGVPSITLMEDALKKATDKRIRALAICKTTKEVSLGNSFKAIPLSDATDAIAREKPDLVIFTPEEPIEQAEKIFAEEYHKAFGH